MCSYVVLFFFFRQKTAYEMRISDWSSDVCSSDLSATWVVSDARLLEPSVDFDSYRAVVTERRPELGDRWPLSRHGGILDFLAPTAASRKIGRAPCRERVGQYG